MKAEMVTHKPFGLGGRLVVRVPCFEKYHIVKGNVVEMKRRNQIYGREKRYGISADRGNGAENRREWR